MKYKKITNTGNREINEDYVDSNTKESSTLFALADGLGGHSSGEVASKLVVVTSIEIHKRRGECGLDLLKRCFEESQNELISQQQNDNKEMKTTFVLAEIVDKKLYYGHIGDSRLYVFRDKKVLVQTRDHSVPQMMVMMGEIKEKDILKHPDRNRVLKAMGEDWDNKPKYQLCEEPIELQENDAILLATDGFWELIDESGMIKLLSKSITVDEWLEKMTAVVEKNGRKKNMDNYSAIGVFV